MESITWTLLMQTLSQEMIAWTGKAASRRRGGRRRRSPSMAAARVLRWCRVVKKILCYSSMYYFWGTLFLSHVPCQCRDAYNWPRVWRCWRVGEHSDETWAPAIKSGTDSGESMVQFLQLLQLYSCTLEGCWPVTPTVTDVELSMTKEKFLLKKVYRRGSTSGTVYPWDLNLLLAATHRLSCVCVWIKCVFFLPTYMYSYFTYSNLEF